MPTQKKAVITTGVFANFTLYDDEANNLLSALKEVVKEGKKIGFLKVLDIYQIDAIERLIKNIELVSYTE